MYAVLSYYYFFAANYVFLWCTLTQCVQGLFSTKILFSCMNWTSASLFTNTNCYIDVCKFYLKYKLKYMKKKKNVDELIFSLINRYDIMVFVHVAGWPGFTVVQEEGIGHLIGPHTSKPFKPDIFQIISIYHCSSCITIKTF